MQLHALTTPKNYKGYVAYSSDTGEYFDISNGSNNLVRVAVPQNFNGEIVVEFRSPVHWRISEWITGLSVVGLIGYALFQLYKKSKEKHYE